MSQVFVGNPTQQHRELHYRLPQHKTARVVKIAAGGQELLPDNLSGSDLQSVITQLEQLGAVPASDIGAIALPKALVYNVSPTPITSDRLEEGLERDEQARQEVSGVKMEEAGLAAFKVAQERAQGANVVETSVEVVETTDRGPVKNGVNAEVIVSSKPSRRAGRIRTEDKN
jgi:hypothetical protein